MADKYGYTFDVVRNIWKELKKDMECSKWLDGRVSAMSPTMEKSPNGKTLDYLLAVVTKFTAVETSIYVAPHGEQSLALIQYHCRNAATVMDVLQSLQTNCETLDVGLANFKMLVVFVYTTAAEDMALFQSEIAKLVQVAECTLNNDNFVVGVGKEDSAKIRSALIPLPMLFIASSRVRDNVISVSNRKDSSWTTHTVYYQLEPPYNFKSLDIDVKPLVTLSISYSRPQSFPLWPKSKKILGIQKQLELFHVPTEGDVYWNHRLCGMSHKLLELLLMPRMKSSTTTVINVWGGGNITEIALVRHSLTLACD